MICLVAEKEMKMERNRRTDPKTVGMENSEIDAKYPTSVLSRDKTQPSKSL
jgi:hypothetical protein